MKYICNVKDGDLVKHVIETSAGNLEVSYGHHDYTKTNEWRFKGVTIGEDYQIQASDKSLSEIVLAIELVKFIKENEK